MILTAFRPEHLAVLRLQPAQASFGAYLDDLAYAETLAAGQSFTGLHDGRVVGCAGVVELWDNRAMAWALLGAGAGAHFVQIHRAVSGFFKQAKWRRIEATVDVDFEAAHRWMAMLGFEREGRMRAYASDGRDQDLYARVTWRK